MSLKDGVSRDRMMSVHDPEMRHGHKSSSRRFDGHKAAIVVDTDSQLITAVAVLPGNAPDNLGALELVEQSEANTGVPVQEAMGDAAYGDGATRQTFADAGRKLVARVPGRPDRKRFPKDDFVIDLAAGSCTCPAGQVTHTIVPAGKRTDAAGRVYRLQAFQFDGAECRTCPLRSQCIAAKGRKGRRVLIHPQEGLLQEARALQQSAAYDEYRARRVAVEHRLARLVQLGIRQSRYFGRVKTRFQLYLAATVANLTLVAGKIGLSDSVGGGAEAHRVVLSAVPSDVQAVSHGVVANATAIFGAVRLGILWTVILLKPALLPKSLSPTRAFQPGFLGLPKGNSGDNHLSPVKLETTNSRIRTNWQLRLSRPRGLAYRKRRLLGATALGWVYRLHALSTQALWRGVAAQGGPSSRSYCRKRWPCSRRRLLRSRWSYPVPRR